jgi:hypothetical protein
MILRPMAVKPVLAALVLVPLLAACPSHSTPPAASDGGGTSLSQDEVVRAEAAARQVASDQGASVSSASVIARPGPAEGSNTGHPCTAGRELEILLIGRFPHTVATGHPVAPESPTPDFTVRAMGITADAETGRVCRTGVQTAEHGVIKRTAGSTTLPIDALGSQLGPPVRGVSCPGSW